MLVLALLSQLLVASAQYSEPVEYHPYDGWYNNLAYPSWGSIDQPMLRKLPVAYADGVYQPSGQHRPNPFDISDAIMSGPAGLGSYRNRSALLVFFGQQVVEEILDAQRSGCPREYFNIKVPTNHPYNPEHKEELEMPLLRSRYDMANSGKSPNSPRQQLNEITPYIDGGLVYGAAKGWADVLRLYKNGLMAVDESNGAWDMADVRGTFPQRNDVRLPMANPPPPRDHYLKNVNRFFKLGNPRGNENPMLLTFGVLLFRYHNWWALRLHQQHPEWHDERLFNEARKMVIGVYQKLVMYDWLPVWLGKDVGSYPGYSNAVNPQIANVFQSAAMRFGHTLVTPGVYRRKPGTCEFLNSTFLTHESGRHAVRTCNSYWNPQEAVEEHDIDAMLLGMASQKCEREDQFIVPDLREAVFGPLEWSRRDLMAINIQRARDHGLPDYNTARVHYGLEPVTNFSQINPALFQSDPTKFDGIMRVYENKLDDIDIWAGGILETTPDGPGPLFRAVILDQFQRIRQGDRLWYENYKLNRMYTEEEVAFINSATLYDLVLNVTNIQPGDIQKDMFFVTNSPCQQPAQLSADNRGQLNECVPLLHFDYFEGSILSYILTFGGVGLFIVVVALLMYICSKTRQHSIAAQKDKLHRSRTARSRNQNSKLKHLIPALEWVGKSQDERPVRLHLDNETQTVKVLPQNGSQPYRTIDMKIVGQSEPLGLHLATDKGSRVLLVHIPKEYDLVLKFSNMRERDDFVDDFIVFTEHVGHTTLTKPLKSILKEAMTHSKRKALLEKFFRAVFNIASKGSRTAAVDDCINSADAKEVLACGLTKHEFADALGMQANSLFVENMFELVDKHKDGYISFREFLDVLIIFHEGSSTDKARLMFDMYDVDKNGLMSKTEFLSMIRSLLEISSSQLQSADSVDKLVSKIFEKGNYGDNFTFEEFSRVLGEYDNVLENTQLNIKGTEKMQSEEPKSTTPQRSQAASLLARNMMSQFNKSDQDDRKLSPRGNSLIDANHLIKATQKQDSGRQRSLTLAASRWFQNYSLHLFWATMYTVVTIFIFCERAYYYSVEREHVGLRRHAGYGVTVTRGAASVMMFTYSSLLLTMSRNLITYLRQTFLHRYIPFDAAIDFHKYIAYLALLGTVIHVIGHSLNFYHIAAQTADDLSCIFRNFHRSTHVLPKFHYWCWETITGVTGCVVTLVIIVMYIYSTQYARRHVHNWFWFTHKLYVVVYILMALHGMGQLVQNPLFQNFFIGPAVIFIIDKLISISGYKVEIPVTKAKHLPSDVTYLKFKRPPNFQYLSGQWVRIAAKKLGGQEYHPFTLTSAPHEKHLSVHIRAVGPWTINLRRLFDPSSVGDFEYPKIYLDGPFGEGHQDWYKFEVAVLVGGGIGVTPFASILKDIAHKTRQAKRIGCKKVYFLWITKTQKQFEWLIDILRDVEKKDKKQLVTTHIFITQLHSKFDMRSTMLYICERRFQKIAGRSLFTGLQAVTHFGRPNFIEVLRALEMGHPGVSRIGVFSCGPPPLTKDLDQACQKLNSEEGALYQHHFENF